MFIKYCRFIFFDAKTTDGSEMTLKLQLKVK